MPHPDLPSEQAFVDRAYRALERMRAEAQRVGDAVRAEGAGGTHAARVERDIFVRTSAARLAQLDIGHEPLVFGRMDMADSGESFHIGRVAVSADDREPLVVDWRAPAAEAFYRATGRHPLGVRLRRHLLCDGPVVRELADEHFAEGGEELGIVGTEALMAALRRARTGRMRDIVGTIQREQDEIIREDLPGILVVQGGPGTGKTAVALHRAAYLMFTHRFVLQRDGLLVVGPNQVFLRYIDHVLPALGESGAGLSTISGLTGGIRVTADEPHDVAKLKGDVRMARVLTRAVKDRERPLREKLVVDVRDRDIVLTVAESQAVVSAVQRRRGPHNDGRAHLFRLVVRRLHRSYAATFADRADLDLTEDDLASELQQEEAFRRALQWMWPRLNSWELVHDLLGSQALIRSAGRGILSAPEMRLLYRPWVDDPRRAPWTRADAALVDEARALLGPRRRRGVPEDEITDYGHIVVDEAQDLSPMELRMLARRSRHGSMTIVGDIAQATGTWTPRSWQDVLAHLPDRGPNRTAELTVNYRTPSEIMDVAARVLDAGKPPESVRSTGEHPRFIEAVPDDFAEALVKESLVALDAAGDGTAAVLCAESAVDRCRTALEAAGVAFERGIDAKLALLSANEAKGLEFDAVVVAEPAAVVEEHGRRALYVALTRATQHLAIVHSRPLPDGLRA